MPISYTQILPRLFVGSGPRLVGDIEALRNDLGVTAVLDLQTDDDKRALRVAWEHLEAGYRDAAIKLVRLPILDFDPADLRAKLPAAVAALRALLLAGRTVYLHCSAGTGRSPSVAVAYLHRCLGWTLERAEAYVQARRFCIPNLDAIRLAAWPPPEVPPAAQPPRP
jgi:atypical dual specificity phosphatase